ncbi:MAG TPA: hypothetical protein VIL97_07655 [Thermoanaerobaculia bacterium]
MALTLLFVLYCLEAGLFFVVAPWTDFWALNPLLHASPLVAQITENPFFRGFVSGLGIVHLMVGAREVMVFLRRRESESAP